MRFRNHVEPSRRSIARVLWLTLAAFVVGVGCTDAGVGPLPETGTDVEQFVALVNDHRAHIGCPELQWNADVATVAQAHSQDMVDREFFSHTNPDGESPFDRLRNAGISYRMAAENIAAGYPTAQAVLDGWLNSPGHRANIENCSLTEHGLGLEQTRWTHVFIRP